MMRGVKFGFRLPNVRGYSSFNYLKDLAEYGESLDFDSIWVSDHLLYPENYGKLTAKSFFFESLTTLAVLSSLTKKVVLGSAVLLPLRNPVLAASILSTIDHASKGRLTVGFGVGWYKPEFDALGVKFEERGKILDEEIEIILQLWSKKKINFKGRYFSLSLSFDSKPYQKPYPRLLFGGKIKYALKRIVKFGGGWIPTFLSVSEYKDGLDRINLACKDLKNKDLLFAIDLPTYVYKGEPDKEDIEFMTKWYGKKKEGIKRLGIFGNYEEAVERIREYMDIGVKHFVFSLIPNYKERLMLEIIKDRVISKL